MHYHVCPVCAYPYMLDPPVETNICPCCGTEFGFDDFDRSHEQLRTEWLGRGAPWFSHATPPPILWDPIKQLAVAGLISLATVAPVNNTRETPEERKLTDKWTISYAATAA